MTTGNLTYDTVLELLPAYALGALEPEEMMAVDEYITAQRYLFQRLEEAERGVTVLAETAPHAPLPTHVRGALMARVQADLNQGRDVQTASTHTSQPRPSQAPVRPSWGEWVRVWWQSNFLSLATAVAAIIALIGVTAYTAQLSGRHQQMQAQLTQLEASNTLLAEQVGVSQTSLDTLNAQLVASTELNSSLQESNASIHAANLALIEQAQDKDDSILDVTDQFLLASNQRDEVEQSNSDLEAELMLTHNRLTIASAATQAAILHGDESVRGAFYATEEDALLVVHGLSPLPEDQTYQFWLVTPDNEQIPAGLVDVIGNDVPSWTNISLPADTPAIIAVGISIEPAGGSPYPTGFMLLEGETS